MDVAPPLDAGSAPFSQLSCQCAGDRQRGIRGPEQHQTGAQPAFAHEAMHRERAMSTLKSQRCAQSPPA
jgi:hypothetical protein